MEKNAETQLPYIEANRNISKAISLGNKIQIESSHFISFRFFLLFRVPIFFYYYCCCYLIFLQNVKYLLLTYIKNFL